MIRPALASDRPAIIASTVLFPQPLCPMRATNSPSPISRSKPLTTATGPVGVGNVLVRLEHLRCFFISILNCRHQRTPEPLKRRAPHRRAEGEINRLELWQRRQFCLARGCLVRASSGSREPSKDGAANFLELRAVIDRRAIARPIERYWDARPKRRAGPSTERYDPIGKHDGFVDIVGDQHDGLSVGAPNA